jgi:hypothetical protein
MGPFMTRVSTACSVLALIRYCVESIQSGPPSSTGLGLVATSGGLEITYARLM